MPDAKTQGDIEFLARAMHRLAKRIKPWHEASQETQERWRAKAIDKLRTDPLVRLILDVSLDDLT